MSQAMFGWLNRVTAGTLTAGSEAAGLGVAQLQTDYGDASTAWQTAAGVLTPAAGAWFSIDSASAATTWRAFVLARTALTTAATVRWRVGPAEAFAVPTALGTDTAAGATAGANTTRVGTTTVADGSTAPVYRNSSTAFAFVSRAATLAADVTYRLTLLVQRISGTGTVGNIISAAYHNGTAGVRANLSMAAVPAVGSMATLSVTFTNRVAGTYSQYFFADTGAVGDVAIWGASLEALPTYDSGTVPAGIRAGIGQSVVVAPAEVSGRYCRCDISDTGNPDGSLNIPLAYAGPTWQPDVNIAPATAFGIDDETVEVTTRSGQEYPDLHWQRRRWDVAHDAVADADLWPRIMAWLAVGRTGRNVLFIRTPEGGDLAAETVFGRAKGGDITFPNGTSNWRAFRARVTERL